MSDAVASLQIDIQTKPAEDAVTRLANSYAGLATALNAVATASGKVPEIKTSGAVESVGDLKQALNELKTAIKSLGAESKTNMVEGFQKQLDEQSAKIAAQTKLIDKQTESIAKLKDKLKQSAEESRASLARISDSANGVSKSMAANAKSVEQVTDRLKILNAEAETMASAKIDFSRVVKGYKSFANSAEDTIPSLRKLIATSEEINYVLNKTKAPEHVLKQYGDGALEAARNVDTLRSKLKGLYAEQYKSDFNLKGIGKDAVFASASLEEQLRIIKLVNQAKADGLTYDQRRRAFGDAATSAEVAGVEKVTQAYKEKAEAMRIAEQRQRILANIELSKSFTADRLRQSTAELANMTSQVMALTSATRNLSSAQVSPLAAVGVNEYATAAARLGGVRGAGGAKGLFEVEESKRVLADMRSHYEQEAAAAAAAAVETAKLTAELEASIAKHARGQAAIRETILRNVELTQSLRQVAGAYNNLNASILGSNEYARPLSAVSVNEYATAAARLGGARGAGGAKGLFEVEESKRVLADMRSHYEQEAAAAAAAAVETAKLTAELEASIAKHARGQAAIRETILRNVELTQSLRQVAGAYNNLNASILGSNEYARPLSAVGVNEYATAAARLGGVRGAGGAKGFFEANESKRVLADMRSHYSNLEASTNSLTKAHKGLGVAFADTHAFARGLSGALGQLWMTYGNIMPLLAGAALGAAFKTAMTAGSEFQYQLTFVKALGEESSAAVQRLSDTALSLGKSSLVGPLELASGLRVLAQAGLTADQAIATLPATINLAIVGEMKMEDAAVTLVGVMNAFSMSVTDMSHIGDVFAKAAALSQSSVSDLTNAMRTASVVGQQYGVSMLDTAAGLTLLAKVNIKGTAAGTALRNMLKELYSPVPAAAAMMKKLGIETADATGNMRPMADVIYDLKDKLVAFDKASQVQILQRLFGERGAKEAIAMLSLSRKEWDKLVDSLDNAQGFMAKVSSELEMTTKGVFLQAQNALQGGLIKAFNDTEGASMRLALSLRELANSEGLYESINVLVSGFTSLLKVLVDIGPTALKFVAIFAGFKIIGSVVTVLGSLVSKVAVAATAFTGFGAASVGVRAALAAFAAKAVVTTGIMGTLARSMAFLLKPWVGLTIIAAMVLDFKDFLKVTPQAVSSSDKLIDASTRYIEKLDEEIKALKERNGLLSAATVGQDFEEAKSKESARLLSLKKELDEASKPGAKYAVDEYGHRIHRDLKEIEAAISASESKLKTLASNAEKVIALESEKKQLILADELSGVQKAIQDAEDRLLVRNQEEQNKAKAEGRAPKLITLKTEIAHVNELTKAYKTLKDAGVTGQPVRTAKIALDNALAQLNLGVPTGTKKLEDEAQSTKQAVERYKATYIDEIKQAQQKIQGAYSEFDSEIRQSVERGTLSIAQSHESRIERLTDDLKKEIIAIDNAIIAAGNDPKFTNENDRNKELERLGSEHATAYAKWRKAVSNEQFLMVKSEEEFNEALTKALVMGGKKVVNAAEQATAEWNAQNGKLANEGALQLQKLGQDLLALEGTDVDTSNIVAEIKRLQDALMSLQDAGEAFKAGKVIEESFKTIDSQIKATTEELARRNTADDKAGFFAIFGGVQETEKWRVAKTAELREAITRIAEEVATAPLGSEKRLKLEADLELKEGELKKLEEMFPPVAERWGTALGDAIAEGLVYGFDQGESPAKRLTNYLKAELKRALAAALAQQFKIGITALLNGVMGGSGGGAQAGGSNMLSTGSNMLSMGSNALSAYNGYNALTAGFEALQTGYQASMAGMDLAAAAQAYNAAGMPGIAEGLQWGQYAGSTLGGGAALGSAAGMSTAANLTAPAVQAGFGTILPAASGAPAATAPTLFGFDPVTLAIAAAVAIALPKLLKGGTPHVGASAFSTGAGYASPRTEEGIDAEFYGNPVLFGGSAITKRYQEGMASTLGPVAETMAQRFNRISEKYEQGAGWKVGLAFSSDNDDPSRGNFGVMSSTGRVLDTGFYEKFNRRPEAGMQQFLEAANKALLKSVAELDISPVIDEFLDSAATSTGNLIDGLSDKMVSTLMMGVETGWLEKIITDLDLVDKSFAGVTGELKNLSDTQAQALGAAFQGGWFDTLVSHLDVTALGLEGVADAAIQTAKTLPVLQQAFGVTADNVLTAFNTALTESDSPQQAGEMFAGLMMNGIYDAMQNQYAGQITSLVMDEIVNPVLIGLQKGATMAEILSDGIIDNAIERAETLAAAYSEMMNSPEFKAAMDRLRKTFDGIGSAGYVAPQPRYTMPDRTAETAANDAARAAEDAARAAAEAAKAAADLIDGIKANINSINTEIRNLSLSNYQIQLAELADSYAAQAAEIAKLTVDQDKATAALERWRLAQLRLINTTNALDEFNAAITRLQDGLRLQGEAERFRMGIADARLTVTDASAAERIDSIETRLGRLLNADYSQFDVESLLAAGGEMQQLVMQRYNIERAELQKTQDEARALADQWQSVAAAARDWIDAFLLGDQSALNGAQKLREAQRQFTTQYSAALGGDAEAGGKVGGSASAYLDAARNQATSRLEYQRVAAQVRASMGTLAEQAATRVTEAERTATATESLVGIQNKALEWLADLSAATDVVDGMIASQINQARTEANNWATLLELLGEKGVLALALGKLPPEIASQIVTGNTNAGTAAIKSYVDTVLATDLTGDEKARAIYDAMLRTNVSVTQLATAMNWEEGAISGWIKTYLAGQTALGLPKEPDTTLTDNLAAITGALGTLDKSVTDGLSSTGAIAFALDYLDGIPGDIVAKWGQDGTIESLLKRAGKDGFIEASKAITDTQIRGAISYAGGIEGDKGRIDTLAEGKFLYDAAMQYGVSFDRLAEVAGWQINDLHNAVREILTYYTTTPSYFKEPTKTSTTSITASGTSAPPSAMGGSNLPTALPPPTGAPSVSSIVTGSVVRDPAPTPTTGAPSVSSIVTGSVVRDPAPTPTYTNQEISSAVNTHLSASGSLMDIYTAAVANNISSSQLAAATGVSVSDINAWVSSQGLKAFAKGGYATPGFAIVGEEGPELIDLKTPGRVYTAPQTQAMLSGGNIAAELKALRAEVAALREANSAENRAIAGHTAKTNRTLDRVMPNGDALDVRIAA